VKWRARRLPSAPTDLCARLGRTESATRFYWRSADGRSELLGLGEVAAVEASGPERFARAEERIAELWREVEDGGVAAPPEAGPLFVGGFGFWDAPSAGGAWRGFPALRFWLPEVLYARVGDRAYKTELAAQGAAPSPRPARRRTPDGVERPAAAGFTAWPEPSRAEFAGAVLRATRAIGEGELAKVVLARACTLSQAGGFEAGRALCALRAAQPGCTVYGVGLGGASFVGASPERLLRREGDRLRADVLAGSAPRGRTPEEDAARARSLFDSPKERAEHAIVRDAVLAALAPRCAELAAAEAPSLLRLAGIQHLHTAVSGRLRAGARGGLLALAAELFPTPAVGGAPREAALAFLRRHEPGERGWYSGAVGWLAPSGDGELSVALRGALLRGDEALLHAGVGIVAGSTPEAELAETRWKLASALGALVEI
jgi:menaquinone-specific isochorismate synthase